jgi:hypothetical protein
MLLILTSIFRKSTSVNSKNDSSTPSSSAILETPLTSISRLESKHKPNILCKTNKNCDCFCISSEPKLALIDIAPESTFNRFAVKSTESNNLIVA